MNTQRGFRDNIGRVLLRDLEAMRSEIEHYPDDETPWTMLPGLSNCGGTLALHVAGNIQHFIGTILGKTSYVRNRDMEFVKRGVSRANLIKELNAAIAVVTQTLGTLDPAVLDELFPQELYNVRVPTDIWLLHLATHVGYHLGQLDYHRRCVTGDSTTVGAMSVPALVIPFPPIPS